MEPDLEKNAAKHAKEDCEKQSEIFVRRKNTHADCSWDKWAEKSFEVDPNYTIYGSGIGFLIFIAFEVMNVLIQTYFARCFEERVFSWGDVKNMLMMDFTKKTFLKGAYFAVSKESKLLVVQSSRLSVFYALLSIIIFTCGKRVLRHHRQVLTDGMNYYSLLAIIMTLYFICQSVGLLLFYGTLAFASWVNMQSALLELTSLFEQSA